MRHSFNHEGRCVHCDIRWSKAVGTQCKGWEPEEDDAA
jgi:hypothetical protein